MGWRDRFSSEARAARDDFQVEYDVAFAEWLIEPSDELGELLDGFAAAEAERDWAWRGEPSTEDRWPV